jgi:hypothetical protein
MLRFLVKAWVLPTKAAVTHHMGDLNVARAENLSVGGRGGRPIPELVQALAEARTAIGASDRQAARTLRLCLSTDPNPAARAIGRAIGPSANWAEASRAALAHPPLTRSAYENPVNDRGFVKTHRSEASAQHVDQKGPFITLSPLWR